MEPSKMAATFVTSADAYDTFMGRYSHPLASAFADAAEVTVGDRVLDVGCGPGALTGVLVDRLGADHVAAIDPSPPFVEECRSRFPGVDVRTATAEEIPFGVDAFDRAMTQLVLHFVAEPAQAVRELHRVVRPGGTIAACVWDSDEEMEMLQHFWDAASDLDQAGPTDARILRFGGPGEIAELFESAGLDDVVETRLQVESTYRDFDELWSGFLAGIGPAGAFCMSLPDGPRAAVRDGLFERVGSPSGAFVLGATARCAFGVRPG